VLYEILVLRVNRGVERPVRNLADWMVRDLLAPLGVQGTDAVVGAFAAASVVVIAYEHSRRPLPLRWRVFAGMAVESTVLAILFGSAIGGLTSTVLDSLPLSLGTQIGRLSLGSQIVLALGAGIYEELVFRALLVTGLAAGVGLIGRASGWPVSMTAAKGTAVVGAALVFSVFHYVGAYGDALAVWSFTFRFIAGLAFSLIFALRGFGIVAWTHALYDVFLILSGMQS